MWVRLDVDHRGAKQKCTRRCRTDHNKTKINEIVFLIFYGLIMNHVYLSVPWSQYFQYLQKLQLQVGPFQVFIRFLNSSRELAL